MAGTGGKVILVTAAASFAGTSLVAILANTPTRELALDFVNGRDIPVPGIRGLTVQMRGRGRGAGAGLSNIGGSGVSVRGGACRFDIRSYPAGTGVAVGKPGSICLAPYHGPPKKGDSSSFSNK